MVFAASFSLGCSPVVHTRLPTTRAVAAAPRHTLRTGLRLRCEAGASTVSGTPNQRIFNGATPPQPYASQPPAAPLPPPATLPPAGAFAKIVELGEAAAKLPFAKLVVMSLLAGAYISYGAMLMLSVGGASANLAQAHPGLHRILLGAIGLPVGLLLVLICGAQLFTGNTATVTAAVLEGKATFGQLLRNWIVSYGCNFAGAFAFLAAVTAAGSLGNLEPAYNFAVAKTSLTFQQAFIRGILANWLVCIAVLMANSTAALASKFVGIVLPISMFVVCGFEHSVANMFIIPAGIAVGAPVSYETFLMANLLPVTLGNIVGGAVCVATAYSFVYGRLGGGKAA